MDYIKDLHELCETLLEAVHDAVERMHGGKLASSDMEYVDRLTHALKSVKAVIAMEDDGYSGNPYSYENGRSNRSYARRDSRGRYSGRPMYSRSGDMLTELRELMQDAPDERTRHEFQRFIDKVESM